MGPILQELPAPDLLNFASTSRACRAAASLSYMQLDINSETGLEAFRSLHRLGCLQKVQEADLKADVSNAAAIGHLTLLGTCTHLKELRLEYDFNPDKLWWWDPYITIYAGPICGVGGDAYTQAKGASLEDRALNMPINALRTITSYEEPWDECICGFHQYSQPEGGLPPVCKNRSSSVARCTGYAAKFRWEAGQPITNHVFYDY